MKSGFSFRGKHSSDFKGVTVKTRDRPVMPKPKVSVYEADNANGSFDFTDYTGQTYYEDRTIQIDLSVTGEDLHDLQNKMNALMVWLTGKGEIIFDDIPTVRWTGRVSEQISYMPEHGGKTAMLSVSFLCEPFSKGLHDVFEGPQLGDPIRLDTAVMLGAEEYLTIVAPESEEETEEEETEIKTTIKILGDVPIKPVIEVSDEAVTLTVVNSLGAFGLTVNYDEEKYTIEQITIDCEKMKVYSIVVVDNKEKLVNLMPYTDGKFPVLMPNEENTIITTLRTKQTAEFHYVPQYFYNGGMS